MKHPETVTSETVAETMTETVPETVTSEIVASETVARRGLVESDVTGNKWQSLIQPVLEPCFCENITNLLTFV